MVKEGYKQTDIGVIPEDWELIPFATSSTMNGRIGWQGLRQEEFTFNDEDPFLITGMNFKDGKIRWDEVYHIPEERYAQAKQIQLNTNDILMTKDGTIGKLLYVDYIPFPYKASLNSHLLLFRPKNHVYDPKFMFYQLHSKHFLQHIELSKSGSTFFGITQNAMGKFKAIIPPLPEQKSIAQALSDTDGLIVSLEKLIAKKVAIKQGTMQQLLTGKKRLTGFSGEWRAFTIEEVAINLDNLRIPLNANQRAMMKGDIPYCGANGIVGHVNDYVIDDDILLMAEDGGYFDEYATRPIVYRMVGKCWVNNHAHILKSKDEFSQDYLFYSLVHKDITKFLASGTRAKLNKSEMYKIEVLAPKDIHEQNAIANILIDMDDEIEMLKTKLSKTKAIKEAMMSELLTGKTRLKVSDS